VIEFHEGLGFHTVMVALNLSYLNKVFKSFINFGKFDQGFFYRKT